MLANRARKRLGGDRFTALESNDLEVVLSLFGNEDLEPIVKALVEAKSVVGGIERVKQSPLYKLHAPNHRAYIHLIDQEIRWWGSHQLRALIEGLRSYPDVVADVCAHIGVKHFKGKPVMEMERLLLLHVGEMMWRRMTDDQRAAAAAAATGPGAGLAAALGGGAAMHAAQFAALRLVGVFGGPIIIGGGLLFTLWSLLGPGYRVLVPCALAIAEARARLWFETLAERNGV